MKGCMSKKIVSSLLSLVLCATAVPMVSLSSSAASTVTPKVATGTKHTVVLKADGTVWATGSNSFGQLGVGQTSTDLAKTATFKQCVDSTDAKIKDATDIACGGYYTAVIRTDKKTGAKTLWQCGWNNDGQLGIGTSGTNESKFVQSQDSSGAITGVEAVACGSNHTAIIRSGGRLWQCGSNTFGQLGIGTSESGTNKTTFVQSQDSSGVIEDATAVACGGLHTAVIRTNKNTGKKTLWQCGYNLYGQLGIGTNGHDTNESKFVQSQDSSGVIEDATAVACGSNHTAIIRSGGRLWQCGYNGNGQLGIGPTGNNSAMDTFVQSQDSSGVIEDATAVACGFKHTAVIRKDKDTEAKTLWQCGDNEYGELGIGTSGNGYMSAKFVQSQDANGVITNVAAVSSGCNAYTTLILRADDNGDLELLGTGYNEDGQLGLGSNNYKNQSKFIKNTMLIEMPTILTEVGQVANRQVTGAGEFENVISVEITWGALTYNYNATWNSAEQKWNQGDWSASKSGADMITVTNNSSADYNVSLAFAVDNAYAAKAENGTKVEGSFVKSSFGTDPIDNDTLKLTTTAANKTGIAYLKLTGMSDKITGLENDLTNKTVGTVTATLKNPTT